MQKTVAAVMLAAMLWGADWAASAQDSSEGDMICRFFLLSGFNRFCCFFGRFFQFFDFLFACGLILCVYKSTASHLLRMLLLSNL